MSPEQVIADSAKLRETSAPEYSVADAIRDARFYRTRPDILVDSKKARQVIATLLAGLEQSSSYLKAVQRGQRTFVLVEQDRAAPLAIIAWAENARSHGCPREKFENALQTVTKWQAKPLTETKWPD